MTEALYIQVMASRCGKLIRLHAFHSTALIPEVPIPEPRPPFSILHSQSFIPGRPSDPFPKPVFPKLHFRLTWGPDLGDFGGVHKSIGQSARVKEEDGLGNMKHEVCGIGNSRLRVLNLIQTILQSSKFIYYLGAHRWWAIHV